MYKIKIEQCQDLDSEIGPADSEEDRNISFSRSGESRGNDGEESNEEWRPAKSGGFLAAPGPGTTRPVRRPVSQQASH